MKLSIAEILHKTVELKTREEKVAFLKANDSIPLRTVLKAMYDKNYEFLLPKGEPVDPETKKSLVKFSNSDENHGQLYQEYKKIKIFIKNGGYPTLKQAKREQMFLNMLETVHRDDAKILLDMKDKKRYKGITVKTINEAIPNLIETD